LLRVYKELNGKDAIIQVDHAGLECSVILGKYPHLDVVSMGPTMCSPHTTTERCYIPTIAPFWDLLRKALEEVPVK
jgi:dipeptidase D